MTVGSDSSSHSVALPEPPPVVDGHAPPIRIEPPGTWELLPAAELWHFRELLYFFVWRDIKVRYKQTVLGASWALLQPALTMIVFVVFFGRLGGMARLVEGPYPVFVYSGLLIWTYFAGAVTLSANSLVGSSHLISKVYFPRLLVPLSAVCAGLLDLAIATSLLFVLMFSYDVSLSAQIWTLPMFVVGTLVAAAGTGFLLSALVVAYRDFRYVTSFVVQIWMFASPVVYPLESVPPTWRLLYSVNPMTGMISGFRSAALGEPFAADVLVVSSLSALVLLIFGTQYFLQVQRRFADII